MEKRIASSSISIFIKKHLHFICVIVFINLSFVSTAQNFDINTLKKLNVNRNKNLDNFFCGVSNTVTYTAIATPIAYYTIGIVQKNKKLQQEAFTNIIALGINSVITVSLKNIVNRPRPAVTYPFLTPVLPLKVHSFPSGHTSLAFCTAMNISMVGKKWYYVVPAFSYAALMGYSRMHLGVHYPSDVLTGAAIGIGSAYLAKVINKKLQGKKWYTKPVNKLLF